MLPNVGWPELTVIAIIALLIFGPQRLAGVGAALGKAIKEFRNAMGDADDGHPDPLRASDHPNRRSH